MEHRSNFKISDEQVSVKLISARAAKAWDTDEIVLDLQYGPKRLQIIVPDPNQEFLGDTWQNDGEELQPVGLNLVFFGPHYT